MKKIVISLLVGISMVAASNLWAMEEEFDDRQRATFSSFESESPPENYLQISKSKFDAFLSSLESETDPEEKKFLEHLAHLNEVTSITFDVVDVRDKGYRIRSQLTASKLDLKIDKSHIVDILPHLFTLLPKVTRMGLCDEENPYFPRGIDNVNNLEDLSVSLCGYDGLPSEFGSLRHLRTLLFNHCHSKEGDAKLSLFQDLGRFDKLWPVLNKLDVYNTPLLKLPYEICNFRALSTLNCLSCQLQSLPAEIGQLTSLTMLNLTKNQLDSLPLEITRLTNLSVLALFANKFTSLPSQIRHLYNLQFLGFNHNELDNIPDGSLPKSLKAISFGKSIEHQKILENWIFKGTSDEEMEDIFEDASDKEMKDL